MITIVLWLNAEYVGPRAVSKWVSVK